MLLNRFLYKCLKSTGKRRYCHYVSTPIFYVNSSPHVGHVYTIVLADAINRYKRLTHNSEETIFSTGTDEHGLKVQTAALIANQTLKDFCDMNSGKFRSVFDDHHLTVTDFVRTTDTEHEIVVKTLWKQLSDKGLIYRNSYSGWYCTSDETFVPENQIESRDSIPVNQEGKTVQWLEEENYIFKFNEFRNSLMNWLKEKKPVVPSRFNEEAITMLEKLDVNELSVSRPKNRVSWGIEVPNDSSQTIYVWLDALTNYLTVSGYPKQFKRWPIDCQVFGKDILKFHAIIWPALLLALDLPLPIKLICHSHWLVESQKMSKSSGNSIDPIVEASHLTTEGLRYYLLRAGTPHSDTNYSREQAIRRLNSELANTYGNLLGRACSSKINPSQSIPVNLSNKPDLIDILELKRKLNDCPGMCAMHYENGDFYRGIEEILSVLRLANVVYDKAQPWILVQKMDRKYHDVQAITFETLRVCSILLQPIVPDLSRKVLNRLNVHDRSWKNSSIRLNTLEDPASSEGSKSTIPLNTENMRPLFPRIKNIDEQ